MLSAASSKVEALGLSERVRLVQGTLDDAPATPLFKAATCILVMHFLPYNGSKLSLLRSIHQHLENGAPLILVDFGGERGSQQFEQIRSAWKFHAISTGAPVDLIEEQLEKVIPHFAVVPEKRAVELLSEAGFTEIMPFYKALMFSGWMAVKT